MAPAASLMACLLALMPLPAFADPVADAFVQATRAVIARPLDAAEAAAVTAEVDAARDADPERTARVAEVLAEMAPLSLRAEHRATRALLDDTMRQLIVVVLPKGDAGAAARLIEAVNPMIGTFQPGLGLTAQDVDAAFWLEARNAEMAGTVPDASPARVSALVEEFRTEPPPNQHFMSRLDGWGLGVVAAWDDLTPAEREAATAVTLRRDPPPPDLVEKVTGGSEVVLWLGGLSIALTEAERRDYPSVTAYFDAGAGSGGVTDILNQRLASQGGGTMADFNSVQMLRNLNRFNWNNGVGSGLDAGSSMLGLE